MNDSTSGRIGTISFDEAFFYGEATVYVFYSCFSSDFDGDSIECSYFDYYFF